MPIPSRLQRVRSAQVPVGEFAAGSDRRIESDEANHFDSGSAEELAGSRERVQEVTPHIPAQHLMRKDLAGRAATSPNLFPSNQEDGKLAAPMRQRARLHDEPSPSETASGETLAVGYERAGIGRALLVHADCLEWMRRVPEGSVQAIVTDPPYGVKEYDKDQLDKRANGKGGVWRIPPAFDGNVRAPLPRFTALDAKERKRLQEFFFEWASQAVRVLHPGGHVMIATNAFLSQIIFESLVKGGLEFRGEIVRLVRTLRGGDRPKNAHEEFPNVCSMARGCYEPWGLLRRALPPKMTVAECLREYGTGGLRRYRNGQPFEDVLQSERTPQREREIADHPSLKPQSLLRRLVWASLPLGEGLVLDPFMGSGSTLAAAEAVGYASLGIEQNKAFFELAKRSVADLARVSTPTVSEQVTLTREPTLFR
jgi:site-specific DNA-methyltransferase (adenine-specific)